MTPHYQGIIPPMITPLKKRDEIDYEGLERLVERLIDGKVSGLFVLGTTGEAPSLSYGVRRELIQATCRLVDGRVPVLTGITDTSLVESANLAAISADAGASAVVTSAPYYFPAGQPELRDYLSELIPNLPLPLLLYNMPALTKTTFSSEVVEWAMDQPSVKGLKDSSGDLTYFRRMRLLAADRRPDWTFLVGPEELLAESVLLGGNGGICGGANLFPEVYVSLYEAAATGDLERTTEYSNRILSLSQSLYTVGQHHSSIIKGIKCALSLIGVCDDFMDAPFHRFDTPERDRIKLALDDSGLLRA